MGECYYKTNCLQNKAAWRKYCDHLASGILELGGGRGQWLVRCFWLLACSCCCQRSYCLCQITALSFKCSCLLVFPCSLCLKFYCLIDLAWSAWKQAVITLSMVDIIFLLWTERIWVCNCTKCCNIAGGQSLVGLWVLTVTSYIVAHPWYSQAGRRPDCCVVPTWIWARLPTSGSILDMVRYHWQECPASHSRRWGSGLQAKRTHLRVFWAAVLLLPCHCGAGTTEGQLHFGFHDFSSWQHISWRRNV